MRHRDRSVARALAFLLVAAALTYALYDRYGSPPSEATIPAAPAQTGESQAAPRGDETIIEAFRQRRSGVLVESEGQVERILTDDLEGSRHQRFIVRLHSGHTLLVSHNIDIASRVPLAESDSVAFRGQYEWNELGGVVHWTHHDPSGIHPGGWIRYREKRYQ